MVKGKKKMTQAETTQRGASSSLLPGVGPTIPPRNYLKRGPASVRQAHRETLNWAYVPSYKTLTGAAYTEFFQIVLNNPYDPDAAVGGTSAHGFAKYMQFYSKCFVLAARIKVSGTKTAAATPGGLLGMHITTDTTAASSAVTCINDGYCQYQVVNSYPDRFHLDLGCDVGKFLNKPDVLDDPELFCTSSSGPGQIVVAHIWGSNYSATSEFVSFVIEVEMDCVFTDPISFT